MGEILRGVPVDLQRFGLQSRSGLRFGGMWRNLSRLW